MSEPFRQKPFSQWEIMNQPLPEYSPPKDPIIKRLESQLATALARAESLEKRNVELADVIRAQTETGVKQIAIISALETRLTSAEHKLEQVDNPDAPLSAELVGGRIVISMGAETLRFCHNENEKEAEPSKGFGTGFLITNALGFAEDVIRELNAEREDGSTIVTDLFDKAVEKAANNGSTNTEERFGWFCGWCDKGMPESERGYVHTNKTCYCSEDCAKEKDANQ